MSADDSIRVILQRERVQVVNKRNSRLMRFLGWLFALVNYDFMGRAWTTVSHKRIYAPVRVDVDGDLEPHRSSLEHELVHIRQFRWISFPLLAFLWRIIFRIGYVFAPVPVLFAAWRWFAERPAYLLQIERHGREVDEVVDTLWRVYAFPWPKEWMRAWFNKRIKRNGDIRMMRGLATRWVASCASRGDPVTSWSDHTSPGRYEGECMWHGPRVRAFVQIDSDGVAYGRCPVCARARERSRRSRRR